MIIDDTNLILEQVNDEVSDFGGLTLANKVIGFSKVMRLFQTNDTDVRIVEVEVTVFKHPETFIRYQLLAVSMGQGSDNEIRVIGRIESKSGRPFEIDAPKGVVSSPEGRWQVCLIGNLYPGFVQV